MVVWDSPGIQPENHEDQNDPHRLREEQPVPAQARLRLVARTEVFNGACWALFQAHRCS